MPKTKDQTHRLMHIVSQLKGNRYPNSKTLMEDFKRFSRADGVDMDCVKKTIMRDMKMLVDEFNCPLAFDRSYNGYYLKNPNWEFTAPAILDANEMLAAVTGARIAEAIFPMPLREKIRKAVNFLMENSNPDFFDTRYLNSLKILSGLYNNIQPKIFQTVYSSWQAQRCIKISYTDFSGNSTERVIEPHALVFYNNTWYIKGFCHLDNAVRVFAIQRIKQAEGLFCTFKQNKEIIDSITWDDFLSFDKVKDVKLRISPFAKERLETQPFSSRQVFNADGTVDIPAVSKELLFPFLASMNTQAELLAPKKLRQEFKQYLTNALEQYK